MTDIQAEAFARMVKWGNVKVITANSSSAWTDADTNVMAPFAGTLKVLEADKLISSKRLITGDFIYSVI